MKESNHPAWTHVRIKRSTKESLEAFGRRIAAFYRRTGLGATEPDSGFSIDMLVNILLEREEDHVKRAERSKARARDRKRQAKQLKEGVFDAENCISPLSEFKNEVEP